MRGKIVVVTGANSGIGKVTATELAKIGATVVMVCRNEEKAKAIQEDINAVTGLNNVDLFICDFSSHESIKKFAIAFRSKYNVVDVLVNNAGVILGERETNDDGIEMMMATNHLGYFLMTHYLLDCLKASDNARVVNVASLAHRFTNYRANDLNADQFFNSFLQYSLSKLCNILFSNKLASMLKNDTNVTSNSLHPGNIGSNFGQSGSPFFKFLVSNFSFVLTSPEKGAETSLYLASSPFVHGKTGKYWYNKKPVPPSLAATNEDNIQHLWNWSLQQTGIKVFGEAEFK
ncbi:MAG: SDR family oxidoreductase [Chitinophagales bacterium]